MAAEPKRGCGYRRIGGLYLVGGGVGVPCDRLPLLLDVCPTCSHGIKPARGFTWVTVDKLVQGPHRLGPGTLQINSDHTAMQFNKGPLCPESERCVFCGNPEQMGRAGLLWIGEQFYATPEEFLVEGRVLGFSRRIKSVPRGFKLGETYVLLAHSKAVRVPVAGLFPRDLATGEMFEAEKFEMKPGIFYVWLPQRLELIFKESDRDSEKVTDAEKRGITPVFLPADDVDHQGSLWKEKE